MLPLVNVSLDSDGVMEVDPCLVVLGKARRVSSNGHWAQFSEGTASEKAIRLGWRTSSTGFLYSQRLNLNIDSI
jgi:hypothetical protein